MRRIFIAPTILLAAVFLLIAAAGDLNISYFPSVSVRDTNYFGEGIVTNGFTVGGVRRTTWPGSGGETNWTQAAGVITAGTNTVVVGDSTGLTNSVQIVINPGADSAVSITDGIDTVFIDVDHNVANVGTGIFVNGKPALITTGTSPNAGDVFVSDGTNEFNGHFQSANIWSRFAVSTNYTTAITNYYISLTGLCTNTLMSAATAGEGRVVKIKALAGGGEIWCQAGDSMDNVTNITLPAWSARTFVSDGTNTWEVN